MTTITTIAQRILDESGFSLSGSGGSLTNLEYLVKNAVDYVNLETDSNINFTPAAGAASLTASDAEISAVKMVSNLLLRARNEKGPNVAITGISMSYITGDPHFTIYMKLLDKVLDRLRGRSFERV